MAIPRRGSAHQRSTGRSSGEGTGWFLSYALPTRSTARSRPDSWRGRKSFARRRRWHKAAGGRKLCPHLQSRPLRRHPQPFTGASSVSFDCFIPLNESVSRTTVSLARVSGSNVSGSKITGCWSLPWAKQLSAGAYRQHCINK